MQCPRCDNALTEARVDEVVLDRCPTCGGIWLDFSHLERLLSRESRALRGLLPSDRQKRREEHHEETIACPRCNGTLLRTNTTPEPVSYYACLTCYGRWIDGNQVDKLVGRPLAAKLEQLLKELLG